MPPASQSTSDDAATARTEPRRRDPLRRERILVSAAQLFGERGYDRAGLTEIGAAAGVTASAVYRHFANKEEILVALFEQLIERLQRETAVLLQADVSPQDRLDHLVELSVEVGSSDREIMGLTPRDLQTLSPAARAKIAREQGKLRASWVSLLRDARPELSETDARAMIAATYGLITSVGSTPGVSPRRLKTILTSMLSSALLAQLDAPARP